MSARQGRRTNSALFFFFFVLHVNTLGVMVVIASNKLPGHQSEREGQYLQHRKTIIV